MDTSFEQKVRERAYEIWVAAGMMDGKATEHWLSAQHALLNEFGGDAAPTVRKAKVTKTRAPAKTTEAKATIGTKTPGTKTTGTKTTKASKPKTRAA